MPLDRIPTQCPACQAKIRMAAQAKPRWQVRAIVQFWIGALVMCFLAFTLGPVLKDLLPESRNLLRSGKTAYALASMPGLLIMCWGLSLPKLRLIRCFECPWRDEVTVREAKTPGRRP